MADKYKSVQHEVQAIQFNFDNLKSIYLFLGMKDVCYTIKNRTITGVVTGKNNEKLAVNKTDFVVKDKDENVSVWKLDEFNKEFVKEVN